jgi:hypothetical protein
MPKLKTELLEEGMVVASDVKNLDNMLLLPAGCTLTEKHIDILQSWGVTEINIEAAEGVAEPVDPLARLTPEEVERVTRETRTLFYQSEEAHPLRQGLFQLILRRRAGRGSHG